MTHILINPGSHRYTLGGEGIIPCDIEQPTSRIREEETTTNKDGGKWGRIDKDNVTITTV